MPDLLLAADVGGTKIDMGLFSLDGGAVKTLRTSSVPTSSYGSAGGALETFILLDALNVKAACIGVAGPVIDGNAYAPNLPWPVTLKGLKKALEIENVELINDLVATAYGLNSLPEESLITLQTGENNPEGTRALIAPGTGLGETIIRDGLPLPSEGGHTDFAPGNDLEIDLLKYMRAKHGGHVSWELIASGPGLAEIFSFIVDTGLAPAKPETMCEIASSDQSALISRQGIACADPACEMALDIFTALLGAEAGNLALKSLAMGGVFLGGGIPPKILPRLKSGPFLERFNSKGRMEELMRKIPVRVITEPKTALYGALNRALELYSATA